MGHEIVDLAGKQARGYVIPLGPVNLVVVVTDKGMVGCGAIDVAALNSFGYPAARVRPAKGGSISSIEDLLAGIIKEANPAAEKMGVNVGHSGRETIYMM
ncbi:MAG: YunC family protein [Methanothrix sp.]|nr:YunC family protein [Methanothrix sp.]